MINAEYMSEWARIDRKQWRTLARALRQNRRRSKRLESIISPRFRSCLAAHNAFARGNFRRALGAGLFNILGAQAPEFIADQDVFSLTLIDGDMVSYPGLPYEEMVVGTVPSMAEIKTHYERLLRGLNYVGMIEPALFVSTQRLYVVPRFVNYHVHCLVWGSTLDEIERLCDRLNRTISPNIPYISAAKCERISPRDLRNVLWYATKMPFEQKQVWVRRTTGRHHVASRALSPLNTVRLCREMASCTLADLAVGGGAGERMVQRALAVASR